MIFSLPLLSAPLTVWRLVSEKFLADAFTGEGAKKYGGRWNRKGEAVIYTASTISLALLEMLVQADPLPAYKAIPATLRAGVPLAELPVSALPAEWRNAIAPEATKKMGTLWLSEKSACVMRVPSAVLPNENNYLLNPDHPDFASVILGDIQDVHIDSRLPSSLLR